MPSSETPWYHLGAPHSRSGYKKRSSSRRNLRKRQNSSSNFRSVSSKSGQSHFRNVSSKSGQSHFRNVSSKAPSGMPRRTPFPFTSTKKERSIIMKRARSA